MWYFFFNDTATTEIYTLSLHDALPIFELDDRRATAADELQVHVRRARVGGEHLLEALDDRWRAARRRQRHHDGTPRTDREVGDRDLVRDDLRDVLALVDAAPHEHDGVLDEVDRGVHVALREEHHLDGALEVLEGHQRPGVALLGHLPGDA